MALTAESSREPIPERRTICVRVILPSIAIRIATDTWGGSLPTTARDGLLQLLLMIWAIYASNEEVPPAETDRLLTLGVLRTDLAGTDRGLSVSNDPIGVRS